MCLTGGQSEKRLHFAECCANPRSTRMQEERSESCSREQSEREQKNLSERVLVAMSGYESKERRLLKRWAEIR